MADIAARRSHRYKTFHAVFKTDRTGRYNHARFAAMNETGPDLAHDDLVLARSCLAGDDEAWKRLVGRHRPAMIKLAARMLPRAAAQDVVDEAIADIWERGKLARYQGRSSLATWLGAVTINAALNAKRTAKAHARKTASDEGASNVAVPQTHDREGRDLAAILTDAIASLPSDLKTLVLMHYEQGLTLDQVAALFARSKSTLSRSLQRARELIHDTADRLAQDRLGVTLAALRANEDLSRLDVDLRAACAKGRDGVVPPVSKS